MKKYTAPELVMTLSQAIAAAQGRNDIYKVGDGWVASSYLPEARAWNASQPMPYSAARHMSSKYTALDAALMLHPDADAIEYAARAEQAIGTLRERIKYICA